MQPSVLKPLILINAFNILQILSGTYLIVFYAVDIITEICNFGDAMEISTMQSAVITAVIRLLLTIIYCYLLLKCSRRKLYLSSCFFSGIFALLLSMFLYIKGNSEKSFNDLIIIGALMLLYISFNSPLMLVPGIMVGELLPLSVRHWSGIIFTAFNLMLFGITKLFPLIKSILKSRGLFLMFGVSSLLATVLFYWLLPETKSRTLNDIEDYYQQPNWVWQRRARKLDKTEKIWTLCEIQSFQIESTGGDVCEINTSTFVRQTKQILNGTLTIRETLETNFSISKDKRNIFRIKWVFKKFWRSSCWVHIKGFVFSVFSWKFSVRKKWQYQVLLKDSSFVVILVKMEFILRRGVFFWILREKSSWVVAGNVVRNLKVICN